jgi:hypothetical protein
MTTQRSVAGWGWQALLVVVVLASAGCDFTLTQDPQTYASLDTPEKAAVDRIFARFQSYEARLRAVTGSRYTLGPPAADHELIDVSTHGLWVMVNIGDDRIHLSVWENLTDDQCARFGSWFGESLAAAAARYGLFFYEYVALHLAGVQTIFAVQDVDWVYTHRNLFNIDRDAERLVDNYLTETDPNLLAYAWATCAAIRGVFDSRYGSMYSKEEYGAHVRELTNPADPSGQIYMICRHLEQAEIRRQTYGMTFLAEIEMLEAKRAGEDFTTAGM